MESTPQSSCLACEFRPDRLFCGMGANAAQEFDAIKSFAVYPRKQVLFAEGRPARGVYVLCNGRAKLSIRADNGRRMTLRVAGPGEVLGLGAALSNTPHEITAELLDKAQVVFVRRQKLLKFLRSHTEVCFKVVGMLSRDLHGAYERVRTVSIIHARRPRIVCRKRRILA
jgi:CRP/FNR family transcriptional regulator, cyclic AMP receptor protein